MGIWMDYKFRDALHKRDGWRCRDCGRSLGRGPDDALPVLGKIKAVRGEGGYGKARLFDLNHQPENLKTLCIPCGKLNTSRLAAERAGSIRRIRMTGITHTRLLNESITRGVDIETLLIQFMDQLGVPGGERTTAVAELPSEITHGTDGETDDSSII